MKNTFAVVAWLASFCATVPLFATETENIDFRILPPPGKVVIDGNAHDWDLSGSMFICSDVENYRDQYASWQSAMYDAENLYLLSRWIDPTPMNNPGLCGSDMGFRGDSLQARLIISSTGTADAAGDDEKIGQKTTHITAWIGRDGRDIIDLAFGKKLKDGEGIKDAKKVGAQQAFVKEADGKGYIQEIAIPWKLLTIDGRGPKAGDSIIMTYEPNFGSASKMRITTKDLFRPGVMPDRVFGFASYTRWGLPKFEASGKITPLPLRLSDSRTFPIHMENGIPTVDWSGLYKEAKLEGFAAIDLQMPEDGFVSLIIKNAEGQVVRNLLNAKFMTKGPQQVMWDGLTTLSDRKPGDPVPAGSYTWEAIWHKGLELKLVGWACNGGKAPFDSPGGNWGGDMGNPCAVDSDAGKMFLGWGSSEAGKALLCTDFDGKVIWRHKRGGFGGAALVAAEKGNVFVYDYGQGNVLYRLDAKKGEYSNWEGRDEATLEVGPILEPFTPTEAKSAPVDPKEKPQAPKATGMAALGGKLLLSYGPIDSAKMKQLSGDVLLILDAATGKLLKSIKVDDPGDLRTGADGKLYMVCGGSNIVRIDPGNGTIEKAIDSLNQVRCVTADKDGNIFAGVGEPDNQVKVFDQAGKLLRSIGKPGGRSLTGLWEKDGMRFMAALKIDLKGKLWVMENDAIPRRISVWDAQTGIFEKEFFGPTDYGAIGGAICPSDPLTVIGHGCEWEIAQDSGKAECVAVITRGKWGNARFGTGKEGRVYAAVSDGWRSMSAVNIFERISAGKWKLRTTISREEESRNKKDTRPRITTVWADRNGDEQQQSDEIKTFDLDLGGWINGWYLYFNQAMTFGGTGYRIDVTGWTPCGAPEYDLAKAEKLPVPEEIASRGGMGAQKGLISQDGNYVLYNGKYGAEHSTFPCYDIRTGKKVFSYPNNYVGVHGGHLAPPAKTGLIRGAYDIAGTVKMPAPLDNLFVIGTDKGEWHLLSSSGYYVSSLFEGDAMKIKWPDEAIPGANMSTVPPGMGAEDFGGSIIQAQDGALYIQCGKTAFIECKVNGLENVKPLAAGTLNLSGDDMVKAQQFKVRYLSESDTVKSIGVKTKSVTFTGNPKEDFGVTPISFGPDNAKVTAWLSHDDENLYVAWDVNDKTPWINGASGFENLYACGDTVDLQLGTDSGADGKRREAVRGDLRLSIGKLQDKITAVIYKKVSEEKSPRKFYSGTSKDGYTMEYVKTLETAKVETKVTAGKKYVIEAAIPLEELGVTLKPAMKLRGDLGATFSDPDGKDTNLRVYWSNQAAGIVADEVEELKMQPAMWGELILE